jgi:hypothetical protein
LDYIDIPADIIEVFWVDCQGYSDWNEKHEFHLMRGKDLWIRSVGYVVDCDEDTLSIALSDCVRLYGDVAQIPISTIKKVRRMKPEKKTIEPKNLYKELNRGR